MNGSDAAERKVCGWRRAMRVWRCN